MVSFFSFILFSVPKGSVKQIQKKRLLRTQMWWVGTGGGGALPFPRPRWSKCCCPHDGVSGPFWAQGLGTSFFGHSPPSLTCFRNFIQVQVMGWVPATFPNSSTDSPARTFWSSGNWMIWGGMAGRGQGTRDKVSNEEGASERLISISAAIHTGLFLSRLLEPSEKHWEQGPLLQNVQLMGLLGLFLYLFFRNGPHNLHGRIFQ